MNKKWRWLMREAKDNFSKQAFLEAMENNQKALRIAQENFQKQLINKPKDAVACLIVSHFSIVDIYLATLRNKQADLCYQACYDFLVAALSSCSNGHGQNALFSGISKLKSEWMCFRKHYHDINPCTSSDINNFSYNLKHYRIEPEDKANHN